MGNELAGRRIAILVANGFEQVEMVKPREALEAAGAQTELISPEEEKVQGWNHDEKGESFPVDKALRLARAEDYDGLLLPGGVANPDKLRTIPGAVKFAQEFAKQDKPIAAICHGPWLLVEVGLVTGKTLTSWPSLKTDVKNAGGQWVDQEVITDHGLITSRKPADIPAFNKKVIEEFQKRTKGKAA